MSKVFNFNDQFKMGQDGEVRVFRALEAEGWGVKRAEAMNLQRMGIDAFIERPFESYSIEIKTDARLEQTNNLFIESSVDSESGRRNAGWLWKTCAQLVVYNTPERLLSFSALDLRTMIQDWLDLENDELITRTSDNGTYKGVGYLVPLETAIKHAWKWSVYL